MADTPVAIVTAAGRGMGEAISRALRDRGYELALMSNGGGAEALADELGVTGMSGSVTDPEALEALVSEAVGRHGRIDAVVNNTGHAPKGPLLEISDDDWHLGLDLILLNVVRMARIVTPHLVAAGGGSIVNISTFATFEPTPAFPVSASFRAALADFTKLYADEYGRHGIRINNVLPGFVENYEIDDETRAGIALGRSARLTEIAGTVAFLLSDDAGYITGQNIRVDGGITRSV